MKKHQPRQRIPRIRAPGLTLFGAVTVGVGAIVGGGVMVLAGPAFAAAGPSALIAFVLNGVVALMTAMSFAEMASAFPESGGTYMFAKKVLSVRWAFVTGWVVWFAYIVAGVLYALGFGAFAVATVAYGCRALGLEGHFSWESDPAYSRGLALLATAIYAASLLRYFARRPAVEPLPPGARLSCSYS